MIPLPPAPAKAAAAMQRIMHAPLYLLILVGLACGCASHPPVSPVLDVFIPDHPPVVRPGPGVPAPIAALSGAWQGIWNDGAPSVLVVRRIDSATADVLLAENQYGDDARLPWHLWARPAVAGGSPAGLKWASEWGAFEFRLSDDGQKLSGVFRRFQPPDREAVKQISMTRREIQSVSHDQQGPPFVCGQTGDILRRLAAQADPAARRALVDEIVEKAKKTGTPLLETGSRFGLTCATFIYHEPADTVALSGMMNGFNPEKDFLTRVAGTDLFYICQEYPSDARIEYNLAVDGQKTLDPLNSRTITFGRKHWQNSVAAMPDYTPPPETRVKPAGDRGTVQEVAIRSRQAEWSRMVTVYLPAGYATSKDRYPVLYLNDGFGARKYGKIVPIMDNLIEWKKIPPLIMVLVPSARDRKVEYRMNPDFESFFVDELVPEIDAHFRSIPSPDHRGIGGISAGAVAALSLSINHPETFGKCMAQSTAGEVAPLLKRARQGPARPFVAYLDVGRFEADFYGRDLVDVAHRLRDSLIANGCRVRYQEVNEGHSWVNWRARTRDAVSFLFSADAADENQT